MTWREKARSVLVELRPKVDKSNLGEARRLVFDAYPFGRRQNTPYKIWCQEVRKCFPWLHPHRQRANLAYERELPWCSDDAR